MLRVYLQRKEAGFLFLTFGFGIQALTAVVNILALCGVGSGLQMLPGKIAVITTFGPWIFALAGWALLAKSKRAKT